MTKKETLNACDTCGQEIPFELEHDLRNYETCDGVYPYPCWLILDAIKELQEIAYADEERRRKEV